MKVKLLMGFAQCLSMIPTTFDGVVWPTDFRNLSNILNIASIDVMGLFSNVCAMHTSFYPKFLAQMFLIPILFLGLSVVWLVVKLVGPFLCAKRMRSVTSESMGAFMFRIAFLVVYTLYTNISTSIFQLFKCHNVEGKLYLVADYKAECNTPEWYFYVVIGVAGMILYTVGIPLFLFLQLYRSRKVLHSDDLEPTLHAEFAMTTRKLGSVYADYSNNAYYYDLLDLFRRIVLTGALVLVGEESGAQIFLGSIVCLIWLSLILNTKPYGSDADNFLSATLSFQLLLITLTGMVRYNIILSCSFSLFELERLLLSNIFRIYNIISFFFIKFLNYILYININRNEGTDHSTKNTCRRQRTNGGHCLWTRVKLCKSPSCLYGSCCHYIEHSMP